MRLPGAAMIFVLIYMVACVKREQPPQGILSKPELVDWMTDIYLAEARTTLLPIPRDSAYKLFIPFQDSLMKRKGLRDSILRKSYEYYLARPDELETLFDAVIDSLNLREQRLRQVPVRP